MPMWCADPATTVQYGQGYLAQQERKRHAVDAAGSSMRWMEIDGYFFAALASRNTRMQRKILVCSTWNEFEIKQYEQAIRQKSKTENAAADTNRARAVEVCADPCGSIRGVNAAKQANS